VSTVSVKKRREPFTRLEDAARAWALGEGLRRKTWLKLDRAVSSLELLGVRCVEQLDVQRAREWLRAMTKQGIPAEERAALLELVAALAAHVERSGGAIPFDRVLELRRFAMNPVRPPTPLEALEDARGYAEAVESGPKPDLMLEARELALVLLDAVRDSRQAFDESGLVALDEKAADAFEKALVAVVKAPPRTRRSRRRGKVQMLHPQPVVEPATESPANEASVQP
jgi:hypothetical protein